MPENVPWVYQKKSPDLIHAWRVGGLLRIILKIVILIIP